jgi:hypothetical protein
MALFSGYVYAVEEIIRGVTTDVANPWGSRGALFLISNRSVGKRGNTSTVAGHCILKNYILALAKTLA